MSDEWNSFDIGSDSSVNLIAFLLALILALFIGYVLPPSISKGANFLRLKRQREREYKENLTRGSYEEPHILRELDILEKEVLLSRHKTVKFWVGINHFTIPINLAVIFVFVYFGFKNNLFESSDYIKLLLVPVLILAFQIRAIFAEQRMYFDLRSPVFAVKGGLIKYIVNRGKRGPRKVFVIRGIEFNDRENPQIDKYWSGWGDGATVYVEYSPFSKHIWKIEKV